MYLFYHVLLRTPLALGTTLVQRAPLVLVQLRRRFLNLGKFDVSVSPRRFPESSTSSLLRLSQFSRHLSRLYLLTVIVVVTCVDLTFILFHRLSACSQRLVVVVVVS